MRYQPTHLNKKRGFALLIAVMFTAVVLAVSLALLDVAYKQVVLASTSRQSAAAFYNADSALECTLYWDKQDTFDYTAEPQSGSITCEGQTFSYAAPTVSLGAARWTTFSIPCGDNIAGDAVADVTIVKQSTGATNIYANGYNTCVASSATRTQRGLKAQYQ